MSADGYLDTSQESSREIRQPAETVGISNQIATLPLVARNDGIDVLGSATIGGNLTIGLLTINDMDASISGDQEVVY